MVLKSGPTNKKSKLHWPFLCNILNFTETLVAFSGQQPTEVAWLLQKKNNIQLHDVEYVESIYCLVCNLPVYG